MSQIIFWSLWYIYTLIAFDESNFLAQLVGSLPCVCAYVALFARMLAYNITQSHMHAMQQTHTHKAVTGQLKPKSYSLVEGNRSIDRNCEGFFIRAIILLAQVHRCSRSHQAYHTYCAWYICTAFSLAHAFLYQFTM